MSADFEFIRGDDELGLTSFEPREAHTVHLKSESVSAETGQPLGEKKLVCSEGSDNDFVAQLRVGENTGGPTVVAKAGELNFGSAMPMTGVSLDRSKNFAERQGFLSSLLVRSDSGGRRPRLHRKILRMDLIPDDSPKTNDLVKVARIMLDKCGFAKKIRGFDGP